MDSQAISQLLHDRLITYGRIILPGIGTIAIEEVPSSIAGDGKTITPPHKAVLFVPKAAEAEAEAGALALAPAASDAITNAATPAATDALSNAAAELLRALTGEDAEQDAAQEVGPNAGGEGAPKADIAVEAPDGQPTVRRSVNLPGFGLFESSVGKEMEFTPDEELLRQCNLYSFEPIVLELQDDKFIFAAETPASTVQEDAEQTAAEPSVTVQEDAAPIAEPAATAQEETDPTPAEVIADAAERDSAQVAVEAESVTTETETARKSTSRTLLIIGIVAAALVIFAALIYLFREELRPVLEKIFYSQQELEVLKHFN